jgi:hypothetical protein
MRGATRNVVLSLALATFFLGAAPAQAISVSELNNVNIGGTLYNVEFKTFRFAFEIYGGFPGSYTFSTQADAENARDIVNAALISAGATSIYDDSKATQIDEDNYNIGYGSQAGTPNKVLTARGRYDGTTWVDDGLGDFGYGTTEQNFADFRRVVPEPGSALLLCVGVAIAGVCGRPRRTHCATA